MTRCLLSSSVLSRQRFFSSGVLVAIWMTARTMYVSNEAINFFIIVRIIKSRHNNPASQAPLEGVIHQYRMINYLFIITNIIIICSRGKYKPSGDKKLSGDRCQHPERLRFIQFWQAEGVATSKLVKTLNY